MGVDAYINKTHKDARSILRLEEKQSKFAQCIPKKRTRHDSTEGKERGTRKRTHPADEDEASDPESDDSVLGTKTRRQTRRKGAHLPDAPGVVELRLYRKTVQVVPPRQVSAVRTACETYTNFVHPPLQHRSNMVLRKSDVGDQRHDVR
jgi:hypothetical protein